MTCLVTQTRHLDPQQQSTSREHGSSHVPGPMTRHRDCDESLCPKDALDLPNGMSVPLGTSSDVPNASLTTPRLAKTTGTPPNRGFASLQPRVPATARPHDRTSSPRTRDDVSEHLDTLSGPTSMVQHPGTHPTTCSRSYDASHAWDASNMQNGMFVP